MSYCPLVAVSCYYSALQLISTQTPSVSLWWMKAHTAGFLCNKRQCVCGLPSPFVDLLLSSGQSLQRGVLQDGGHTLIHSYLGDSSTHEPRP